MSLEAVENEQQARLYGRARAKEIFQPVPWNPLKPVPDDTTQLYEHIDATGYRIRAIKPVQATLAEVEAILTAPTSLGGKDDTIPTLLAQLLPGSYISGGRIARYPVLELSTTEHEHVALQYARIKPYVTKPPTPTPHEAIPLVSLDKFVLLSYTLSTRLQRSDKSSLGNSHRSASSVPSLLHLYRQVQVPSFASRRPNFHPKRLANYDWSITYIIQERASGNTVDRHAFVTVEVVLEWMWGHVVEVQTLDDACLQRLRSDALSLVRLQPLIEAFRLAQLALNATSTGTLNSVKEKRLCDMCQRKIGPFRRKKQCETCRKWLCIHCVGSKSFSRLRRHKSVSCVRCVEEAQNGLTIQTNESATMSVFQFPAVESVVVSSRARDASKRSSSSRLSNRKEIDLGLDPALGIVVATHERRVSQDKTELRSSASMRHEQQLENDMARTTLETSIIARNRVPKKLMATHDCTHLCVELGTPKMDYQVEYMGSCEYPKAPVFQSETEMARAKYVEGTGLYFDARLLRLLRHDPVLEDLAYQVVSISSQWHGCSINLVGAYDVYCLVSAFIVPELDVDDADFLELETSPVTFDDIVPREESVSAYAVYHQSTFFVADLAKDVRFQMHPFHTECGVVSFCSFPLYSTRNDTEDSSVYCVATLDLWKRDPLLGCSHVSSEWMATIETLRITISARIEALARESYSFKKPRACAAYSFGSSSDSIGSTRPADSMTDLYDIDSESVVDWPTSESGDRYRPLKTRGLGGNGSSWKYDSDNESSTSSTTSSCNQTPRISSQCYTAAEMHSTIESLLQKASKTSQYLSQTGVSI
ncbi:hypothetical protein CCR75_002688 [Bremia lactucae]|uniref:FYVE-type domain-containing protein n=1 Tax=Bremia lactucae TaxID=4779 RepID=A0A976FRN8_BRELC|nr:hypothetical protein CCR75_002688 [Bremia lactucae]